MRDGEKHTSDRVTRMEHIGRQRKATCSSIVRVHRLEEYASRFFIFRHFIVASVRR